MLNYKKAFIGYSNNKIVRYSGSSGGIGTEILQYLLSEKLVDGVIGVGFANDKVRPIYKVIYKIEDVYQLSGSKYVFMGYKELAYIIKENSNKKLAVVVQPCFANAVKSKFLNVEYVISFFCGYNMSFDATKYLLKKSKVDCKDIFGIDYRGGKYPGGFTIYKNNGEIKSFNKEHYELMNLMFLRNGCNFCGHYISNVADIVLGDAWVKNLKKSTLMIINTQKGDEIIKKLYKYELISLYKISKDDIYKMHRHNIEYKTRGHSKIMKLILKVFNNNIAKKYAPFYFLGFLSKIRRMFKVGINIKIEKIEEYK